MTFHGEPWNRTTWLAWIDALAAVGLDSRQPDVDDVSWFDVQEGLAEWFRALMDGGAEAGFRAPAPK